MAEYTYILTAGGPVTGSPLPPFFTFGDVAVFNLTFASGELQDGDRLTVAIDSNMEFYDPLSATGDASVMAVAHEDITSEYDGTSVQVEVPLNTDVFRQRVNGRENPLLVHVGIYRLRGEAYSELGRLSGYAFPVVAGPNTVTPVLPVTDYPTRQEAEALTDRSEAAAERAEQAAAGIVPPLQLDAPPTTSTAGSVGQLATWHDPNAADQEHADHLYHLVFISTSDSATLYHWEECVLVSQGNVAGGYPVLDENALILSGNLPIASTVQHGAVRYPPSTNNRNVAFKSQDGRIYPVSAANADIDTRQNGGSHANYDFIVPSNLDYAVRSVLPNVTEIPAATSDYSLVDSSATTLNHSHTFVHTPTQAPTYRLPSVSDTTVSHYIELTVDFTNVQTYSFLDANGDALVPLFTPSIAAGDVYTFRMEYSAIKSKWLIYPQKQGAVADDFVMRGEVGAANGVAGLNGNAVVPLSNLKYADVNSGGIVHRLSQEHGISNESDWTQIYKATESNIDARTSHFKPIVPVTLNYAVTAALTDSNKISLNDAQKAAAQEVFGIGGPITEIPAATSEYTLSEGIFKHAPTNAPTYNLPAITDTIRSHVIVLAIDFSSVQTFSFVPPQDSGITFQSYANPNQGDVWVFRCVWYGGKWRICPLKIKNCVTRQLTSGALAITDAVSGDALALKMTAPRSVVVNQLVTNGDFSDGTTGWAENIGFNTIAASGNVLTVTYTADGNSFVYTQLQLQAGHKYAVMFEARPSVSVEGLSVYIFNSQGASVNAADNYTAAAANTWTRKLVLFTAAYGDSNNLRIFARKLISGNNGIGTGGTLQIRNAQCVDLTQYFNGDQTLIDSITSWDDLVAYDPRFASYVEYNTGEVVGVTPTVKVMGKNLSNVTSGSTVYTGLSYSQVTSTTSFNSLGAGSLADNTVINGASYIQNNDTVWYLHSAGNTVTAGSSSVSASRSNDVPYGFGVVKKVKQGTYTFSCNVQCDTSKQYRVSIVYLDKDGYLLSHAAISAGTSVTSRIYTMTVPAYAEWAVMVFSHYNQSYLNISNIQLELGSSPTAYEPYHDGGSATAPSELFGVYHENSYTNYALDSFDAVSGISYNAIGVVDLGTLNWTNYTAPTDTKPVGETHMSLSGKAIGRNNLLLANYLTNATNADKTIHGATGTSYVELHDVSLQGKTGTEIATALSGQLLYYELAIPTTSSTTPATLTLQAGDNVAMQTDGGRLAPIDITYESNEI